MTKEEFLQCLRDDVEFRQEVVYILFAGLEMEMNDRSLRLYHYDLPQNSREISSEYIPESDQATREDWMI